MSEYKLQKWLSSGKYLPSFLRDFHDQKDLFKSIYHIYEIDGSEPHDIPWVNAHIFVIDKFLWFMASRGYTLQKTRTKGLDFYKYPNYRELMRKAMSDD